MGAVLVATAENAQEGFSCLAGDAGRYLHRPPIRYTANMAPSAVTSLVGLAAAACAGAGLVTVYWQRRRRRAVVKVWFRNSRIVVTEYFLGETAKDMQHILNHPTLRWPVLGDDEDTPHPIMWYPKSADEGNGKDSSTISLRGGTRELLFEFLQPPRHTEAEISAIDAAAKWPVTPGTQLMMDNRYIRAWDFRLKDGTADPSTEAASKGVHQHVLDNFFIVLEPGRLHFHKRVPGSGSDDLQYQGVLKFGKRAGNLGFAQWQEVPNGGWRVEDGEPQSVHAVTNAWPGRQWREYYVELK